ncbi:sulfatase [Gracilibacillus halophilus YIM-C55.5]|uniref:Sulfatase n=1 Tax=Gracilibacillus halophilus YIM-C55.5 TaxID=1308866 RepID=N4WFU4_9BACI|nr:sulfatase [Gracilibacillus halophilus]ENH98134.1 sulfatase [Gracilibacillus halophilus YIM-C55.5]
MKVIQVMFDTLKRNSLNAYETSDIKTPNFDRLQKKTVQFNNFFSGSLPCMPARRDMQTGRYNFLHRGWGPMEPYDDSMPEILKQNGIYTHLVTDHKHYWRDGGATYHPRYSSYELIRGQEGDNWKAKVDKDMEIEGLDHIPEAFKKRKMASMSQDFVNREHMPNEEDHFLHRTVEAGMEFLRENKDADNWFLQIECFDPHEPFFVPEKYLQMYGLSQDDFNGWLLYSHDDYSTEQSQQMKGFYKALVTMCDAYLGKVLDYMDEHHMWEDTMLIVNTDHGLLLGEHDWWGKNIMPVYNEIAHLPFFIWYPQLGVHNESRNQLAQNIDLPATILEFFHLDRPDFMRGKSLRNVIESEDEVNHDAILFGTFGSNVNVADQEYVYMRAPIPGKEEYLYEYTLSPMRMNRRFTTDELKDAVFEHSFEFTKGVGTLKMQTSDFMGKSYQRFGNKLFNYQEDPEQKNPLNDIEKEFEMINKLKEIMTENEAPSSLFTYYGLDQIHTVEDLRKEHELLDREQEAYCKNLKFSNYNIKDGYLTVINAVNDSTIAQSLQTDFEKNIDVVTEEVLRNWIQENLEPKEKARILYQLDMTLRID